MLELDFYDVFEVFRLYYRRIRDLREDSDLTQAQIAQAINVTQRSYSYYEKGTHMIPPWVLSALADFHHTSVDYLLGRTHGRARIPRRVAERAGPFFARRLFS